jgi:3-isopropylmalate/(R)-2-methylmalate dehydratase small subunit
MKRRVEGPVMRLGHNFDINRILSTASSSSGEMTSSLFRDNSADISTTLKKSGIILGGRNFGKGTPREEAILYLKSIGISCVIASSFVRLFFRSAINQGIVLIESAEAFEQISDGETITVDFDRSEIICKKGMIKFPPYPDIISKILNSGGLLAHAKKALGK